MKTKVSQAFLYSLMITMTFINCTERTPQFTQIERPPDVYSKRIAIYSDSVYQIIADHWKNYYAVFPSEYSYANWMYATRYAGQSNYKDLLMDGVAKFPANPTLLYLAGMREHKSPSSEADLALTRRASELDPDYMDPWFSLVIEYLARGEISLMDNALEHLLKGGAISEEVMDYNYNMLSSLGENAILITNGDIDTYPGWILQNILNFRQDVTIINRSLLNTKWYSAHLINSGVPRFITADSLQHLRKTVRGPWDELLIDRIIETCSESGRPVYFSHTLYQTSRIKSHMEKGRNLGLVTLVTPAQIPYQEQIMQMVEVVLGDFRTAGMDSWELRYADYSQSGLRLMSNYVKALIRLAEGTSGMKPDHHADMFNWYLKHCQDLLPDEQQEYFDQVWCGLSDDHDIQGWCHKEGYTSN